MGQAAWLTRQPRSTSSSRPFHNRCVTVSQVVKPTWSMVMMHLMCSRLTTRAFSRHRMAEG